MATGQTLTLAEIESQFDSEWVLLDNPDIDEFQRVVGGKVVAHSKDRDEVYRKAIELRLSRSATLYTGKISEGMAVML